MHEQGRNAPKYERSEETEGERAREACQAGTGGHYQVALWLMVQRLAAAE